MDNLRQNQDNKTKKTVSFLTVLLVTSAVIASTVLVNCGSSDKKQNNRETFHTSTERKNDDTITADGQTLAEAKKIKQTTQRGKLTDARFSPARGFVDTEFRVLVRTKSPLEADQYITFKIWKNGDVLDERDEGIISPYTLQKNDECFVEAILHEGDKVIGIKRTNAILIQNSPPKITQVNYPDVKGPGKYDITLEAEDLDKDDMVFTLESEEPQMESLIDPVTGTVTVTLGTPPPKVLVLIVAVSDGDNGTAKKRLIMKFGAPKKKKAATTPEPQAELPE